MSTPPLRASNPDADVPYAGVLSLFSAYWKAYGGFKALVKSPFLHLALVASLLAPGWVHSEWWNDPLAMLPNLLGFSLASLTLLVAVGDEKFRTMLALKGHPVARYVELTAAFMHFVVIQCVALFLALAAKAWSGDVTQSFATLVISSGLPAVMLTAAKLLWWFFGYVAFIYALTSTLAATTWIFRVIRLFVLSERLAQENADAEAAQAAIAGTSPKSEGLGGTTADGAQVQPVTGLPGASLA